MKVVLTALCAFALVWDAAGSEGRAPKPLDLRDTEPAIQLRRLLELPVRDRELPQEAAAKYIDWIPTPPRITGWDSQLGILCLAWARDAASEAALKSYVASWEGQVHPWGLMAATRVYALTVRAALRQDNEGYFRELARALQQTNDPDVRMLLANRLWVDFGARAESQIFAALQVSLPRDQREPHSWDTVAAEELLYYLASTRDAALARKVCEHLTLFKPSMYNTYGRCHEVRNLMVVTTPRRGWRDTENDGSCARGILETKWRN